MIYIFVFFFLNFSYAFLSFQIFLFYLPQLNIKILFVWIRYVSGNNTLGLFISGAARLLLFFFYSIFSGDNLVLNFMYKYCTCQLYDFWMIFFSPELMYRHFFKTIELIFTISQHFTWIEYNTYLCLKELLRRLCIL